MTNSCVHCVQAFTACICGTKLKVILWNTAKHRLCLYGFCVFWHFVNRTTFLCHRSWTEFAISRKYNGFTIDRAVWLLYSDRRHSTGRSIALCIWPRRINCWRKLLIYMTVSALLPDACLIGCNAIALTCFSILRIYHNVVVVERLSRSCSRNAFIQSAYCTSLSVSADSLIYFRICLPQYGRPWQEK